MLAPRASHAFVCIRCELQLVRPCLPAYPRRTPHANFSASARRPDGAHHLDALSPPATPGPTIRREAQPLNRITKRKGKVLRETSARLGGGVKRLGDDAEILVLREVDAPEETPVEAEPTEPLAAPDIVASLQQEREVVITPEKIQDRLESMRPRPSAEPGEPLYMPLKVFTKLMRDLNRGFTQRQLLQFYRAAGNVETEIFHKELVASLKAETGNAKGPTTRTHWQPGTTPATQRLPGVHVTNKRKRVPVSKQLLVDRIIRDLWKVVPLEEIEALGEIELSLRPWQITLLNTGEDTVLNKISMARKVRLEIFQPHNILRITASKTTAEYAADDVDEALQHIETKKVQLKVWTPRLEKSKVPKDEKLATLFSEEDFRIISAATRASIQRMDNTNTLVLRAFERSAVDEAGRALLRLLPLSDDTVRTIDTREIDDKQSEVHLLPASYETTSLDAHHRGTHLGRWTSPVASKSHGTAIKAHGPGTGAGDKSTDILVPDKHQVASIVQTLRQSVKKSSTTITEAPGDKESTFWSPEPEVELSAHFGQALFPMASAVPNSTSEPSPSSPSQPLFTSSLPGLARLLSSAHMPNRATGRQLPHFKAGGSVQMPSLLYDFIAAPKPSELEPGQVPPSLQIQLETSESEGKVTLQRFSLGFQQYVHKVLLPRKAADVQFTRQGRLLLRSKKNKSFSKVFREWFSAVKANIASGERLTAPDISIAVPKWTITGNPADKDSKLITYLFSGVRYQQVIRGQFQHEHVSYTTVQSGKLGAQGGRLSMSYNRTATSAAELLQNDKGTLTSFVEKSLSFADTITEAAGQTVPIAKMLHPRSQEKRRKQRRLEEQAAAASSQGAPVGEKSDDDMLDMLDNAVEQDQEQPKAISDDMLDMLDNAVEQDQEQPKARSDGSSDEVDMHDTTLSDELPPAHSEQITPSTDRSVADEATGPASPEESAKSLP